jgi:hypothetical protein
LPNKTIYVRDADLPLWEKAQKELGESMSSIFTDYLRERLELKARRPKPKKETLDMVQAMDLLLVEINARYDFDIERHPSWSPVILDVNSDNIGFKLHQKRANPDRIMSLVVHPLAFEKNGQLSSATKNRIISEIEKFWDGKRNDRHTFVNAAE